MRPWLVGLLAAAALGATALVLTTEGPGRLLFAVVAVGAGFEAGRGLVPTLVADTEGVDVTVGVSRHRYAWADVAAIGRLGPPEGGARPRRRANALELDLGDRLVVVAAYRLGAPVPDVVSALCSVSGGGGGGL
jgi:hypothetical protein